jgi:hypothetical protein
MHVNAGPMMDLYGQKTNIRNQAPFAKG